MADEHSRSVCPYCQTVLAQPPHRKERCPSCGHKFIVYRGQLLTEDEARIEVWLSRLIQFNITRNDFENYRRESSQRLGVTASIDETVRRILNAQIAARRDPNLIHRAYDELVRLAAEEGQDLKPYVSQAQKMEQKAELEQRRAAFWREMIEIRSRRSVWYVQVQTCDDEYVCPACKLLATDLYRVDEAPELPYAQCQSEGGCRCSVAAVPGKSRGVWFWWTRFTRRLDTALAMTAVQALIRSWWMRFTRWLARQHTRH